MLPQPPPNIPVDMGFVPTPEERNLAMLAHLSALGGLILGSGLLGFLGPLIFYVTQKDKSAFITFHARDSLNHQITLLLFNVVCSVMLFIGSFFCIGFLMIIPLGVAVITSIVFEILACVQASRGEWTKIPLTIPFVK